MAELTLEQIRESRDKLLDTIDNLNDLLRDKGDDLTAVEIKEINKATRRLNNAITELNAKAIEGTVKELNRAVDGVRKATINANDALDTIQNIRDAIKIVTALVGLGTAIAAGNPQGIVTAATDVLTTVKEASKI